MKIVLSKEEIEKIISEHFETKMYPDDVKLKFDWGLIPDVLDPVELILEVDSYV